MTATKRHPVIEILGEEKVTHLVTKHSMKSIYFGIKYHPDNRNRGVIEAFERCFSKHGYASYCVARDLEQWGAVSYSEKEIMRETFSKIDLADLVLIDLSEKGVGLGIEVGYAKGKGKTVIVTVKKGTEVSATIRGTADRIIEYESISELKLIETELPN